MGRPWNAAESPQRQIAKDPHCSSAAEELNKLSDPKSFARKFAFAPPEQRDQLTQWLPSGSPLARRMHRNTRTTLPQYYEMKLLSDPPPKRTAEDILFDYLDPEERGIQSKSIAHSSTDRIPHSEFSLLTLIGTALPQRNEVRTHLCLGSTEIAQWIVRAAAALSLQCTHVLIHRYSCLLLL